MTADANPFPDGSRIMTRYPAPGQADAPREAWPWHPAVIEERCGADEWLVTLTAPELAELEDGAPAVFRGASEIRPAAHVRFLVGLTGRKNTMSRTNWRDKISQLDTRRGTLRVWVQTNSGTELLAADDDAHDLLDALAAVDLWGVPGPPDEDDEVPVAGAGGAQYLAERAQYLAEFASEIRPAGGFSVGVQQQFNPAAGSHPDE